MLIHFFTKEVVIKSGTEMKEFLAQAGLRETGALDDVAQAARDAATVLEVTACIIGVFARGCCAVRFVVRRYGVVLYCME